MKSYNKFYNKNFCLIIPARLSSSRLPKKVLKKINNTTVIEHVYNICKKKIDERIIFIATPDIEVAELCKSKKIKFIKTSQTCLTGTDRVYEASKKLNKKYIINVQADEIFLDPNNITNVCKEIIKDNYSVVNCFGKINNKSDFFSKSIPKVVMNEKKELIYISRAAIPSSKKIQFNNSFKQICVYGFTKKSLKVFGKYNKKSFNENYEDIEILRFLEKGIKVKMIKGKGSKLAIDTKEDYLLAKKILK
tara:strand:+ start:891 stop:1637 length:747 start_codon:yes stop_codon:yes gene_type:complete